MPLRIQCPECSARLTAPDSAAGQEIECPKCGGLLALPTAEPEADEPAPVRRKSRPRDGEDETPRKKRSKPAAKSSKSPLLIGAGVVVVLVGVGLAFMLGGPKKDKPNAGGGGSSDGAGGGGGTTPPLATADYKVISPRVRFNLEVPKRPANDFGDAAPRVDRFLLTPDGSRLVAHYLIRGGHIQAWDTRGQPKKLHAGPGSMSDSIMSPDGTWLSVYRGEKRINMSIETGQELPDKRFLGGNESNVFLAGPDRVIACDTGGGSPSPLVITEYAISTGQRLGAVTANDTGAVDLTPPIKQGRELVFLIKKTDRVRVWDIAEKKVAREFTLAASRHPEPVVGRTGFRASVDGNWLALRRVASIKNDRVEFFDHSGARVASLPEHVSDMWGEFVPNRPLYVAPALHVDPVISPVKSVFGKFDVTVFDIRQQKFVVAYRGHENNIMGLAVSANGKVMATADTTGAVCVWDLDQVN